MRRHGTGSVRQRDSGRWQALYSVSVDGKRRQVSRSFDTETEADAWLRTNDREQVPATIVRDALAEVLAIHDAGICHILCMFGREGGDPDDCSCRCEGELHGLARDGMPKVKLRRLTTHFRRNGARRPGDHDRDGAGEDRPDGALSAV